MPVDLQRFLDAQAHGHESVLAELRNGRKTGHWMWFVFPQIAGLGRSAVSRQYAIVSLEEARAYLGNPILAARLHDCADALLSVEDRSAETILGPIDAVKLRSSMTLFHRADPAEPRFGEVLARFFEGRPDPTTDALLSGREPLS